MSDPLHPFSPTQDGDRLVLQVRVPTAAESRGQALAVGFGVLTVFSMGMELPHAISIVCGLVALVAGAVFLWQRLIGKGQLHPLRFGREALYLQNRNVLREDSERVTQRNHELIVHCQSEQGWYKSSFAFRHSNAEVALLAQVMRTWIEGGDLSMQPIRSADRGAAIVERLEALQPETTVDGIEIPLLSAQWYRPGVRLMGVVGFLNAAGILLSSSTVENYLLGFVFAVVSAGLLYLGWRPGQRRLRIGPDALEIVGARRLPWDRIRGASVHGSRELIVHTLDGDWPLAVSTGAGTLSEVISDLAEWHEEAVPEGLERLRQGSSIERQHE